MPTTKALVILMRQGNTNQHGGMEYGADLRHRDPEACLISAFALWFFWRWEVDIRDTLVRLLGVRRDAFTGVR